MAKKQWTVVSKDKRRTRIADSDGVVKTLMTPTGKNAKYKHEIEQGVLFTNEGKKKLNKKGKEIRLTDTQRAYRYGYRAALGEQSAIYKSKNNKKGSF